MKKFPYSVAMLIVLTVPCLTGAMDYHIEFQGFNPNANALQKTIGWAIDLAALGTVAKLTYATQSVGFTERVKWGFFRRFMSFPIEIARAGLLLATGADSFLQRNGYYFPLCAITKYGVALGKDFESPETEWFGSKGYDTWCLVFPVASLIAIDLRAGQH